jgi:hypothetical protein
MLVWMPTLLQLVPVVLSLLVLGAHFLRGGNTPLVAVSLGLLVLLAVRRRWAARVLQVALLLGALEWIRTLLTLAGGRMQAGQPVLRLAIILGAVAAVTGLSALLFQTHRLRRVYRLRRQAPPRDGLI